ncbi:MAG: ATP-dependent Clp protease ATP-binding subunit, partial [bacterium]|nr:ATP-dependent Clp protease ATP-binding subunit [bacterium]
IFTYQALETAVNLSDRYIHDRVLPDKAADIIDEAAVAVACSGRKFITSEDIAGVIAEKTHVLVKQITEDDAQRLLHLEEKLHERLIGQDEAVGAVADALRRARVGLRPGNRPIGTLLFVGPTGVGKTELAKALAEAYFGDEKTMIRLDMSEYQTIESINNLIGSPPRGEETVAGGYFTEEIRRRPFSLILLDEIEKAHPKILDLFLQVFDDARLTDSLGHTVDFRETIIIATSNVGGNLLEKGLREGKQMDELKKDLEESLHEVFRPEFLNRFDGIVVYRPLSYLEVEKIVDLKIKDLENRLAKQDIKIKISSDFRRVLARAGYRPEMGARPLGRIIADNIEAPLAKEILAGKIKPGSIVELTDKFLK